MIEANDLKIGDILLLKDNTQHFFRHVMVVSHIDPEKNEYKIIHWRGIGEPFAITEAALPSSEFLKIRNSHFECFRLNDHQQALNALSILKQWLTWAIPYDKNRFANAEKELNRFFSLASDFYNHCPPKIDEASFLPKLEPHRQLMERLFLERPMDIVKYAARRDISPVRPKPHGEPQSGFTCVQGVLLAFQISYVQEQIYSVTDKWLSNKNVVTNLLLDDAQPKFESATQALSGGIELANILDPIPLAFRLYAKLCLVDVFRQAMVDDVKTITSLGMLNPLSEVEIKPDAEAVAQSSLFFKSVGNLKRDKLLEEVIIPSIKQR